VEHEVHADADALVVALRGEVDLEHSPRARAVLLKAVEDAASVLVDLSGVTYIDSSGVASLVEAFQSARGRGSQFALVAMSAPVQRVLELARLDRVFTIHASVARGLGRED